MKQLISKPFPYYCGVFSLEELVTKQSKVCVINILGGESRKVTPVSHEYSGGNVVAGVQYGRVGQLETKRGNIPVFRSIRDVMREGIEFDMGVIYLPPAAVSQAAAELVTFNDKLKRIVIVTEKVPSRDSMYIRFIAQEAGVDVIGANCLGVANVWDHVRVGGALGGDSPEETLKKGSVAIHSNSGNFTTTIAEYLRTGGFGISTAVSSGKDVYIHFALPEFLFAAQNDPRTKAVALYVEPGGYYEKMALDWIKERQFGFSKPIVVCVTGRWKKDLTRSCGHAGALAGGGDDAICKESWFDDYFGADVFNPENPVVSKRGVRIASIQDFPRAMQAVYDKIDEAPDFPSSGDLSLKLWISDNIIKLPAHLETPVVKALPPYDEQIIEINKQIGANFLRQNMRDKSGASRIDEKTLVAELHGASILDLANKSIEENIFFSIAKVFPEPEDLKTLNMLLNIFLKIEPQNFSFLNLAKDNGATPNAYIASQMLAIGAKPFFKKVSDMSNLIINFIRDYSIDENTTDYPAALINAIEENILTDNNTNEESKLVDLLTKEVKNSRKRCESLKLCQFILDYSEKTGKPIRDKYEFLLAAITICLFWKPMLQKRITRKTAEDAITYLYCISCVVALSCVNMEENKYWQKLVDPKPVNLTGSFTENVFRILFDREPKDNDMVELKYLIGLTLTNGPGTLSAKGAKETVSAKNHIPVCYAGFMTNTGLAHGGNGFEAVEFLLDTFSNVSIKNPGESSHGIDLKELANRTAKEYRDKKRNERELGALNTSKIPCVNHPVFKGNDVNIDPREDYVRKELKSHNIYNIFLEFYHSLVNELFNEGVTRNVFCVNVDAVISVISLKLLWEDYSKGRFTKQHIQDLVFILFLIGRAVGVTAEIIDHRDRGTDMDCRTPQKELQFVY